MYSNQLNYQTFCPWYRTQKPLETEGLFYLAVWTGLEPATPCVTGMYSNQLNYQTKILIVCQRNFTFAKYQERNVLFFCGLDGTRTRDPILDRHVCYPTELPNLMPKKTVHDSIISMVQIYNHFVMLQIFFETIVCIIYPEQKQTSFLTIYKSKFRISDPDFLFCFSFYYNNLKNA